MRKGVRRTANMKLSGNRGSKTPKPAELSVKQRKANDTTTGLITRFGLKLDKIALKHGKKRQKDEWFHFHAATCTRVCCHAFMKVCVEQARRRHSRSQVVSFWFSIGAHGRRPSNEAVSHSQEFIVFIAFTSSFFSSARIPFF